MTDLIKYIIPLLLLFVSLIWFVACNIPNAKSMNLSDLQLTDLQGNIVDIAKLKGQPVLVNFWATWCPPCIKEKPHLEQARKILQTEGYKFVVISDEKPNIIQKYKDKHPYGFDYYKLGGLKQTYGVFSIPQTYVFDKSGKLVHESSGFTIWDSPENIKLLRQLANKGVD